MHHPSGPQVGDSGASPAASGPWLVGCSPDRTLVAVPTEGADGLVELVKVYETGSLDEARAEAGLSRRLDIPGLIRYREARLDPRTGKPAVVTELVRGIDLARWVAERGPLSPRAAATVTRRVAATVAAMHAPAAANTEAPAGLVHRDIKPSNLMLVGAQPDPLHNDVVVIDLEHALPLSDGAAAGVAGQAFTGGSRGYAPPEAHAGAPPTTAFDVFGLGATLFFLLSGELAFPGQDEAALRTSFRRARDGRLARALAGSPDELATLVLACVAEDPAHRPSMAEVEARLATWLATPREGADERLDLAQRALQSAEFDEARRLLGSAGDEHARGQRLRALLERREAQWRRLPPLHVEPAGDGDPLAVARQVRRIGRLLLAVTGRFPAAPAALQARAALQQRLADLLLELPRALDRVKRAARFDEGLALLETTLVAVDTAASLPGGLAPAQEAMRRREPAQGLHPGPLQRDPFRFLALAMEDVQSAARSHQRWIDELHAAEAEFDVRRIQRVLDAIADFHGGASEVTATLRERHHRLTFYIERLAEPAEQIERLRHELRAAGLPDHLEAVGALQERCATARGTESASGGERPQGGLRSLRRALRSITEEFPHLRAGVAGAAGELETAMAGLTEHAWALLAEAQHKLGATPVPIRPLQALLSRIDGLRLVGALIDLPDRQRSDLLEELERVRMRLDEARSTRDRIAHGAREAMRRGHLTTALFDMERALDALGGDDDSAGGGDELVAELAEARRKKAAIEEAAARNVTLAGRHAMLVDDPSSTVAERLGVLEQRRDALLFLLGHLQSERAEPYARDLRDVQVALLQERAEAAELALRGVDDPRERIRQLDAALDQIRAEAAEVGADGEPLGRVQRLLDRLQDELGRAHAQVARETARDAAQAAATRRRRLRAVALVAAVAVIAAGVQLVPSIARGGADPVDELAAALRQQLVGPPAEANAAGEPGAGATRDELAGFVETLDKNRLPADPHAAFPALLAGARSLLARIDEAAGTPALGPWLAGLEVDLETWWENVTRLEAGLDGSDTGTEITEIVEALQRFGDHARAAAVLRAAQRDALAEAEAAALLDLIAGTPLAGGPFAETLRARAGR